MRMADLLGEDVVKNRLKRTIKDFSFFSGIDCHKFAWLQIAAACEELWGFTPGMMFGFSAPGSACSFVFTKDNLASLLREVENNKAKQEMLMRWFGGSGHCLFGDIKGLCKNQWSEKELLDPKKVRWRTHAWCYQHGQECPITLPQRGDENSMSTQGSPCQLFSRNLGMQRM